jgi:hypothetical protein
MKKNLRKFIKTKIKKIKKYKFSIILTSLIFLSTFLVFAIYFSKKTPKKQFKIIENNIQFFFLDENQKIIKVKPQKYENFLGRNPEEYEIYKLPKYEKPKKK